MYLAAFYPQFVFAEFLSIKTASRFRCDLLFNAFDEQNRKPLLRLLIDP